VKAIHFRDDPILTCAHVSVPPNDQSLQQAINHSAAVWNNLEESGIPGIRGVWCHEIGAGSLFNVISLKQMYTGHAQKAGIIASQNVSLTVNRYTVVVDDDIDPFDLEEVLWAVVTRAPAEESIQILKHCRGIAADPAIPLAEKLKYRSEPKPLYGSQVVVNGCQPFEHKADWYPVVRISAELRDRVLKKWSPVLSQYLKPHSDER
jgi:UbiD family decarboxylase